MSFVYLIEAQNGLVKIGSSICPTSRLLATRTHSPVLVRLIAMWPGNRADEYELHARFEEYRSHSEWFKIEGEIIKFVDTYRGIGVQSVEDWDRNMYYNRNIIRQETNQKLSVAQKKYWDSAHPNTPNGPIHILSQER